MADEYRDMASFITFNGTYKLTEIPFGFMNAPVSFQKILDQIIKAFPFVRICLNDVVIISKFHDDHGTIWLSF